MKSSQLRRSVLVIVVLVTAFAMTQPAQAQLFTHTAFGQGTDDFGSRLSILAVDNALLGGLGLASVRLANESGPARLVILTCVIFDERVGPGFHFVYTSGRSLNGRDYYLGVFDDFGPGRTGPTDDMYTQTTPVSGPCNVAAVSSYPIGWFPVASGAFTVN